MSPVADVDVIVVGAGMAGLTAARQLKKKGYEVIVLEARDRPGGRIHTASIGGTNLDLGAAWIHGPKTNPLSELARKAGINTFLSDEDEALFYGADGSTLADQKIDQAEADFKALLKKAQARAEKKKEDRSLKDAILAIDPDALEDPLYQFMLTGYLEFDYGAPADELSAWYYDEDEAFKGTDQLLKEGYGRLIDYLAEGLDIRYNVVVQKIEYGSDGVEAFTNEGNFESYFAVVTLPLGVLKNEDVEFDPGLPEKKRKAIDAVGFGSVNKVVLRFEEAFWPKEKHFFGILGRNDGDFPYWLNAYPFTGEPILVGIALSFYADGDMQSKDETAVTDDALDALRTAFGDAVSVPEESIVTRWREEPFSRGSYSFAAVGATNEDFNKLAASVKDVLFFAGEHTSRKYRGTAHGAHLSGIRVAKEIWEADD